MEGKSREEVMAERKLRKSAKKSKKQNSTKEQAGEPSLGSAPQVEELSKTIENLQISETKDDRLVSEGVSLTMEKLTNCVAGCSSNSSDQKTSVGNEHNKKIKNVKVPETEKSSTASKIFLQNVDESTSSSTSSLKVPETNSIKDEEERSAGPTSKSNEKVNDGKNESQVAEVTKSKAQLKAERRALQEAQRALKAQKKSNEEVNKTENVVKPKGKATSSTKTNKEIIASKSNDPNKVKMVSHLYLDTHPKTLDIFKKCRSGIHQSVIKLGLQYKHKIIIGSNARVVALLNTLKQVLTDYDCEHNFPREFEVMLECTVQYLRTCRPPSVSMTNAVKFLKWHLTQLPNNIPSSEAQIKLREVIADYLRDIDLAGKAISDTVRRKISQDDVILTFGYSSLIKRILKESFESGIKFRVIIVDSGPLYEGKQLLKQLAKKDLPCTYVLLSAASYIMKEATKVLLGAHALLTNGYVMSRAGASQIALIARSYNVPVLVCCETHKFSERVQTDALVYNELGDPLPLMKHQPKSNTYLKSLTLMYDVTPSDFVTAVVTELAILPCTSVPVVLRVKPANPSYN